MTKNKIVRVMVAIFTLVICAGQSICLGSATITFYTGTGVLLKDHLNTTTLPVNTFLVQLIWSGDSSLASLDPDSPLSVSGNDVLLATFRPSVSAGRLRANDYLASTPIMTASTTQQYLESNYSMPGGYSTFVGGYVFARYFETTTPAVGSWYHSTQVYAGAQQTILTVDGSGNDTTFDAPIGAGYTDTQIVAVPEPSTIGLLLVGAGLVAFRRMRRS